MGRLRALVLQAQQVHATPYATAQQKLLHVAPPKGCNTQQPAGEARRRQVLAMLEAHPEARYAAMTDTQAAPGFVLLALAIRDLATVDLLIPAGKWDGVLFLELLERHGGTVH